MAHTRMKTFPIFFVAAIAFVALCSFGATLTAGGASMMGGISDLNTVARECQRTFDFQDQSCFKKFEAKAKALAAQGAVLSGMAGGILGE